MTGAHKFQRDFRELRLSTDFDNGALARVEESETNVFDCWPYEPNEYREGFLRLARADGRDEERDGANFCFHFRLNGCRNRKVTLRFHVVRERIKDGDTSVVYANPDFPVFSYDGRKWWRAANKSLTGGSGFSDEKIVSVEQTFEEDRVWVAYQYPFTNDRLSRFIQEIENSPFCQVDVAGRSTEGRDIRQISVTDPGVPLKQKKVAWFTGLQHCAELGAGWGLQGMVNFLLSNDPASITARQKYEFKIIPIVNVDAISEGRGRSHRSGKNINREWEKPDPICDIGSIRKTLDDWKAQGNPIDIFMDFHGFSTACGRWTAPFLPEGSYSDTRAKEYQRLLEVIRGRVPQIIFEPHPSVGLAAGAGCRRYGALSLSLDGYVYGWPSERVPNLSSFFDQGATVWPLDEIEEAGGLFVKALLDFAR